MPNLAVDPACASLPTTVEMGARAYVGVPVVRGDGSFFGTLCGLDPNVRSVPGDKIALMQVLARLAVSYLDREDQEQARRAAERQLALTKDAVVSIVSHELRAPVASIVGFAELLLTREPSAAERQKYLGIIADEGRRLTALINDFLDLQRLKSGPAHLTVEPIDLWPLLERAALAAGADAERPIVVAPAHRLPLVLAHADRIQQVLSNLLSNARKYSPGGGAVYLTAHVLNGEVEVSVRDQGLGLPAASLPQLFNEFYRVDNVDRRAITGTGLGLAITRQIIQAHGGRIWAESDGPGRGARFCFTVPIADLDGGNTPA